jgi:hypothetical protein
LTIRHVLIITAFCIRLYRAEQSNFKPSCNSFGIIPVVDSTSGIMYAIFSCHILISSSFKSVYFWRFPVIMLQSYIIIIIIIITYLLTYLLHGAESFLRS